MKSLQKAVYLMLAIVMALSLVACGDQGSDQTPSDADSAGNWPTQPVNVVGAGSAGGAFDSVLRTMSPYFNEYSGKPMVINNVSGVSAYEQIHSGTPDGYNFLLGGTTYFTAKADGTTDFDWQDYEVVATIPSGTAYCIVVRNDSPYQTINDLLDDIKANPGKVTGGTQQTGHGAYFTTKLQEVLGYDLYLVDLGSTNERNTALLGNQVDYIITNFIGCQTYIESGDFRALVQDGETRSKVAPDVPTFIESGIDCAFIDQLAVWTAPKGTPKEACDAMNAVIAKIYATQEFRDAMSGKGQIIDFEIPDTDESYRICQEYSEEILSTLGK